MATLVLATSAITIHSLNHVRSTTSIFADQHYFVSRLENYLVKFVEVLDKVRLYTFYGLEDDIKHLEWLELHSEWQVVSIMVLLILGDAIYNTKRIGGNEIFIPIFKSSSHLEYHPL